jgi:hypothetical protein
MKNKSDLIDNYENNTQSILELKEYFNELVPEGFLVRIHYNSNRNIDLEVYEPSEISGQKELLFRKWDINYNNYTESPQIKYDGKHYGKTGSLDIVMKKLKWSNEDIIKIKKKLDEAKCIGITNGKISEIEYGYRGMGMYSYLIFDENLDDETQKKYTDYCSSLFFKDNVVLRYSSGAIGSFCVEDFKEQ